MDKELRQKYELSPEKLRYTANPKEFKSTNKIEPGLEAIIIGQEKAKKSLDEGLEKNDKYHNIFVTVPHGIETKDIIKAKITDYIKTMPKQDYEEKISQRKDLVSAYNFKDPHNPLILELLNGQGKKFKEETEKTIDEIQQKGAEALKSKISSLTKAYDGIYASLNDSTKKKTASLKKEYEHAEKEKKEITAKCDAMPADDPSRKDLEKKLEVINMRIQDILNENDSVTLDYQSQALELQAKENEEKKELMQNFSNHYVKNRMEGLIKKYGLNKEILGYLTELGDNVSQDVEEGTKGSQTNQEGPMGLLNLGGGIALASAPPQAPPKTKKDTSKFMLKLLNELSPEQSILGVPVIFEEKPTLESIFGKVESSSYVLSYNQWEEKKDHNTRLEAGSLIKANGGYLVINIPEALEREPALVSMLVRLFEDIKDEKTNIRPRDSIYAFSKPVISKDIKLSTKVILTGKNSFYQLLLGYTEETGMFKKFEELFQTKVELDSVTNNTPQSRELYSAHIDSFCKKEGLKVLTPEGKSEIINHATRLAGTQRKLTLEAEIEYLIRDSNYKAKNSNKITAEHVKEAIEAKKNMHNLVKSKVEEFITDGTQIIDTEKEIIGDVNALVVYTLEDSRFGAPTKLTATTSVGNQGVISLDMEAGSSGEIFKKAVFTLRKNLERLFAQDKTISLNGGISFEQNYRGIDGDSAILASFLGIASVLSDHPVDQAIAVTGSMNQKGLVQPIGGVNEKVEGFYQICKAKGLTGSQGIIIPNLNEKDLMLSDEIVDSVKSGRFHLYSVSKLEEAIEIIMGNKACEYDADGKRLFSEGTVYDKVNKKIIDYNNALKSKSDKE